MQTDASVFESAVASKSQDSKSKHLSAVTTSRRAEELRTVLGHKARYLVREDVGPLDQSQAPPAHNWQVRTQMCKACLLPPDSSIEMNGDEMSLTLFDGPKHTLNSSIAYVATFAVTLIQTCRGRFQLVHAELVCELNTALVQITGSGQL